MAAKPTKAEIEAAVSGYVEEASKPPPKNKRGKGGRPYALEVRAETLRMLRGAGMIQCTMDQAAAMLEVSEKTLKAFFVREPAAKEAFDRGKKQGVASLRQSQFNLAKRFPQMAQWLGKQYLDQRDPDRQNWQEILARRNADNPPAPLSPMRVVAVFPKPMASDDELPTPALADSKPAE